MNKSGQNHFTVWIVLRDNLFVLDLEEQDKSSDIEQQLPFGDRK